MKKIILSIVSILILNSCKKDIECECTTEFSGTGKQTTTTTSFETYHTTKRQAKLNQCADSKVIIPLGVNNVNQPNNGTTIRSCKIK